MAQLERPAPFVVGMSRSGTTLLRLMLDAHPEIAIPAESQFYPALLAVDVTRDGWVDAAIRAITESHTWGDYTLDADTFGRAVRAARPAGVGDVLRTFYRSYAARFGKPAWGDKWPGNIQRMREIAHVLPEARFVHIIRDGRDVAASMREMWWRPGDSYEACIALWAQRVQGARAQAGAATSALPYLEVRYEALIRAARPTLERVCAFIGVAYDERMLDFHLRARERHAEIGDWNFEGRLIPRETLVAVHANTQRPLTADPIGRWRAVMTPADVAACERVAGTLLRDLGYR